VTSVLRTANFARLWMAIFVSTIGNFLLMLSLSVYMYRRTGDNFAAAAVFGTQWLATMFSASLGGWLTARLRSARLAATCEIAGGCASLLIGACIASLPAVYGLLLLRGLAESVSKSARVVAMRDHVPDELIERAASLIGTATFIGISVGSLAGAVLIDVIGIAQVTLIDAGTFVVGAGLYLSLSGPVRRVATAVQPALRDVARVGFAAVRADPALARNVAYMVVVTAFFQGFHNIARALLPITRLGMGESGVMLLQALASVSFFCGAIVVTLLMQSRQAAGRAEPWMLCAASAVLMLAAVLTTQRAPSLAAYCAYLMCSEVAFVFCQKNVVMLCPREQLGLVSSLALSAATLCMVAVIYLGGWLSDRVGLVSTGLLVFVAVAACTVAVEIRSPRPFRLPAAHPSTGDE